MAGAVRDSLHRPRTVAATAHDDRVRAAASPARRGRRATWSTPSRTAPRRPAHRSSARSRSSVGWWRCAPTSPTTARSVEAHGGTVNDVIPATITGAARLAARARRVDARDPRGAPWCPSRSSTTRWRARSAARSRPLRRPAGPRGQPGPVRLHQVSYSSWPTKRDRPCGRGDPADQHLRLRPRDLPRDRVAGAARERRSYELNVTNVPAAGEAYAAGARMLETYPSRRCWRVTRWRSA